jgi:hypothetical protein
MKKTTQLNLILSIAILLDTPRLLGASNTVVRVVGVTVRSQSELQLELSNIPTKGADILELPLRNSPEKFSIKTEILP